MGDVLYKRSFSLPYLRCLRPSEADYVLREVNEWICGNHLGGRSLAKSESAREVRSDSLDSILTESTSYEMMFAIKDMVKPLKDIVTRYIPDITEIPLEQGIEWLPSWKASPSKRKLSKDQKGSPFAILHRELEAFIAYMPDQSSFERFGPELLSATFEVFAILSLTSEIELSYRSEKDTRIFVEKARAELPLIPLDEAESPGRLAYTTDSGAGKRRVFAIGNFIFQRTLRPLYDFIMKVLRRIPMDGTFDQVRPLDRLRSSIQVYSYDLKSATDRWPLWYQLCIVLTLFGPFVSDYIRFLYILVPFDVPFIMKKWMSPQRLALEGGQPLGYYASWPLFTLSHYYLVWWCAEQVYPSKRFTRYAILGDDICIADSKVAKVYRDALETLKVQSLVSEIGCAEFAKKFRVRGLTVDLSPVSFQNLFNSHHIAGAMAVANTYILSRLNHPLSARYQRLRAVWDKLRLPFELAYKPKDLVVMPESLYQDVASAHFSEYTLPC
ncbi:hypothetical protein Lal_00001586 [Lupinus albus]|nr:hypothetical protein Lal_00001586 [Lupinus albus]